jgi:hypothetical protein
MKPIEITITNPKVCDILEQLAQLHGRSVEEEAKRYMDTLEHLSMGAAEVAVDPQVPNLGKWFAQRFKNDPVDVDFEDYRGFEPKPATFED